jgi:hypothetical protein
MFEQVVEESSEIASARVSSVYRKSMKKTIFRNRQKSVQAGSIRNLSLSKISEEKTDNNSSSETLKLENKVNGCHVTFVCDDDKVIGGRSDSANKDNADESEVRPERKTNTRKPAENMKESCLLSRFVPEFIDSNKISIV